MITRRTLVASVGASLATPTLGQEIVDLALVLVLDESSSMSAGERRLMFEATAKALRDNDSRLLEQRVVLALVGFNDTPNLRVGWTVLDNENRLFRLADRIASMGDGRGRGSTGIGSALLFTATLFETLDALPLRSVVDVAGDGNNNVGPLPKEIEMGDIVVNGLPIMADPDFINIDHYYATQVQRGLGSFTLPAYGWEEFPQAMRSKLQMEIM